MQTEINLACANSRFLDRGSCAVIFESREEEEEGASFSLWCDADANAETTMMMNEIHGEQEDYECCPLSKKRKIDAYIIYICILYRCHAYAVQKST